MEDHGFLLGKPLAFKCERFARGPAAVHGVAMANPRSASDASYDASDPAQVEKATKAAQLREAEHRRIETELLHTKSGREWVWAVLGDLHVFEQRIPMSGGLYEVGVLNGEREAGLRLMRRLCRSNPSDFAKMISENDRG